MFSGEIGRHGDGHLLSLHIASYAGDGGKSLTESVVQVQVLPEQIFASMLELVDKGDLKSPGIKPVRVRVSFDAPNCALSNYKYSYIVGDWNEYLQTLS